MTGPYRLPALHSSGPFTGVDHVPDRNFTPAPVTVLALDMANRQAAVVDRVGRLAVVPWANLKLDPQTKEDRTRATEPTSTE